MPKLRSRASRAAAGIAALAVAGALSAGTPSPENAPPQEATPPPTQGSQSGAASAPSHTAHAASKQSHTPAPAAKHSVAATHYHPDRFAGRAGTYYRLIWGVDSLEVKWGESGEVIRFTYTVLDANKAKVLNDKRFEPSLIDPKAGVSLVIPSMENVGQLRQTAPPENGKAYWMVFSNKGRLVKRGDHVDVVIGTFRAQGLVVD